MNRKKFSSILFEARTALELSPEEMAFILSMPDQVYKRYERGQFDDTYSIRKDRLQNKLGSLDIEIEKKILMLKAALRKFQQNNRSNGTHNYTPNMKPSSKKLRIKSV